MTSADEFVLQLLIDKGIVDSAAIEIARAKVAELDGDGNPDTETLELLVSEHTVTQQQIAFGTGAGNTGSCKNFINTARRSKEIITINCCTN